MNRPDFRRASVQVTVLLGTLLLFLITNSLFRDNPALGFIPPLVAAAIVVEIAVFVGMEVKEGAQKHGWKHEIVDTIIALGVALFVWYGASIVLNTSSPVSGVVSCSMLPNLQRGDFVIVQGAPVLAYQVNMSPDELYSLSDRATVRFNGTDFSMDGSMFPYCVRNRNEPLCQAFISSPESIVERKGAFTYRYEKCNMSFSSGDRASEPCLRSVEFRGKEYLTDFSHDVIVYQPARSDVFSRVGDIVHRVLFVADVNGKKYYITRGDNNPVLDIQVFDYGASMGNSPVPQERSRGKVIARIPYLGYFKLFISGYLNEDAQCKTQLEFAHS